MGKKKPNVLTLDDATMDRLQERYLALQRDVIAGMRDLPTVDQILSGMGIEPTRPLTFDEQNFYVATMGYYLRNTYREKHKIIFVSQLERAFDFVMMFFQPEMVVWSVRSLMTNFELKDPMKEVEFTKNAVWVKFLSQYGELAFEV